MAKQNEQKLHKYQFFKNKKKIDKIYKSYITTKISFYIDLY